MRDARKCACRPEASVPRNWCNIRGAGVGSKPTTETADGEVLDAYFWLKTPGEALNLAVNTME